MQLQNTGGGKLPSLPPYCDILEGSSFLVTSGAGSEQSLQLPPPGPPSVLSPTPCVLTPLLKVGQARTGFRRVLGPSLVLPKTPALEDKGKWGGKRYFGDREMGGESWELGRGCRESVPGE